MKNLFLAVGSLLFLSAQSSYVKPTCQENSYWNGSKCVCNYGYDSIDGKCVSRCGENQVWGGTKCYCASGFKW